MKIVSGKVRKPIIIPNKEVSDAAPRKASINLNFFGMSVIELPDWIAMTNAEIDIVKTRVNMNSD